MSSEDDPYGAINFGEYRKYMQNKQAKLKQQQKELEEQASQQLPQIFTGTSIYINGYMNPPANELRRMIIQHGGDYQHYLKKSNVTHILATNLTNSKLQEFRSYKVVKPEWIVDSIQAQQLLPWQTYRLVPRETSQKQLLFKPTGEKLNADVLSNDWARQISSANPAFIKRYYETSRLHYLSTWKAELKDIVEKLEQKYPSKLDRKRKKTTPRVIMHIDFDCFFASVGIKDRPHLKHLPVAVSHSKQVAEGSSSDIASCNYVARSFGIRNGMTIGTAKRLCPDLQVIPYEFEKYKAISVQFYEIVFQYADEIQAVSVDEALLEVGSHITQPGSGQEEMLATKIRDEIREVTGCEASIGIGSNILIARLSTKKAKPAGQYFCRTSEDLEELLSNLDVTDLPGVGYAIADKLKELKISVVSDIRRVSLHELQSKLGAKMGQTLFDFSRGIDDRPLTTNQQRQSVSAEVNWGIRFETEENQQQFIRGLSKEVAERLQKHQLKGRSITVKILKRQEDATQAAKNLGHGRVDSFSKTCSVGAFTDDSDAIYKHVYTMLSSFQFPCADIRGLGIHISKLNNQEKPSSDQGTLKFSARSTSDPTVHQHQPSEEVAGPSNREPKEDMEVDANVFNELPESVKQELQSNYNIKFTKTENNEMTEQKTDLKPTGSPLPELPPWSQVDPMALLALPNDMRDQVLELYANQSKANTTTPNPPNRRTYSAPVDSRPSKASSSSSTGGISSHSKKTSLTQIFPPDPTNLSHATTLSVYSNPTVRSTNGPMQDDDTSLPYNLDVWEALPLDIQKELMAEHRRSIKTKKQEEESKRLQKKHRSNKDILKKIDLPHTQEPSLQDITDIKELRSLLREWVNAYQEGPESEDVATISDYLVDLVHYRDLEKVQLLVAYLKHLVKGYDSESNPWKSCIANMEKKASDATQSIYGCPLKM